MGQKLHDFIDYKVPFYELVDNIDYWIENKEHRWIINIDIDYFFASCSNSYYQIFTDEFIIAFVIQYKKPSKRLQ